MGADDRNDDAIPGECPGHEWRTIEVVAARDGAYVEQVCIRCGVMALVTPDELGGWV